MIKNSRKAQGISINMIIIAVLALIVLIVVVAIFTGRIKIFSGTLESCRAKQGQCESGAICPENKAQVAAKCPETEEEKKQQKNICCIQVLK